MGLQIQCSTPTNLHHDHLPIIKEHSKYQVSGALLVMLYKEYTKILGQLQLSVGLSSVRMWAYS